MSKSYKMKASEIIVIGGAKQEQMRLVFKHQHPLIYWMLEETQWGLALHTSNNRTYVRVFEANEKNRKKWHYNPNYCLLRLPCGYYYCETVVYTTVRKIVEWKSRNPLPRGSLGVSLPNLMMTGYINIQLF